MVTTEVFRRDIDILQKGEVGNSRGMSIEKKIEFLESLIGKLKDAESMKITRIKKKKGSSVVVSSITLAHILKMSKEGIC